MPYFHCYPDNFLVGTQGLSHELTAAYFRIVMKIYSTGGSLPNDPEWLRHLLGKRDRRPVARIVAELVSLGKLSIDVEGRLSNDRAAHELGKFVRRDDGLRPQSHPQSRGGSHPQSTPQSNGGSVAENATNTTRAHAPDARPFQNSEAYKREKPLSHSTSSAPGPMTLSQAIERRLAQLKHEEESRDDPTGHND